MCWSIRVRSTQSSRKPNRSPKRSFGSTLELVKNLRPLLQTTWVRVLHRNRIHGVVLRWDTRRVTFVDLNAAYGQVYLDKSRQWQSSMVFVMATVNSKQVLRR